ncbi:MAG: peptide-methionine (S)-S-oxide reductase [Synergistaceae bacterium]|jgi:peptide-methionine (S)-S-oxide reductase|nr:peptide-methionine (S)-S-oxide reductase [Synergistaceae bacterium]
MPVTEVDEVEYIPRIDRMRPPCLDTAVFGMACFFSFEPRFGITKGIWKTIVGYAGGKYESPTYSNMGDHVQAVMIEYDPSTISYGQLLEIFLRWQKPLSKGASLKGAPNREASHIFVKNEFEKRLAQAAMERYELCSGSSCGALVSVCKSFYEAEDWCQKYFLRTFPIFMKEIQNFYPEEREGVRSTLAARLNGILGQPSLSFNLPENIELYDLSESAVRTLEHLTP